VPYLHLKPEEIIVGEFVIEEEDCVVVGMEAVLPVGEIEATKVVLQSSFLLEFPCSTRESETPSALEPIEKKSKIVFSLVGNSQSQEESGVALLNKFLGCPLDLSQALYLLPVATHRTDHRAAA